MSIRKNKRHAGATNEQYDAWLANEFGAGNHFSAILNGRLVGPYPMTGEMLALFRTDPTCECVTIYETGEIVWDRNTGLSNFYAKRRKTSRFGVWQWNDWTRDIPTLICDPIDNHGVYFAELIPSWPNDVNDRGEYEWDGSFDPENEATNWTLEIYDTEFGEEDWTEVYGTAREAMEEADDFIAKFITRENLVGNGPYTLASRGKTATKRKRAWQDDTVVYRIILPCIIYGDHGRYIDGSRYDPSAIVRVSSSGHVYGHAGFDEDMQFSSHYDKELTGMTWPEIKNWCYEQVMDIISDMGEFLNQIGDIEVLVDATDYVYLDQYGIGTIAPDGYGPHSASRRRARRNKTSEITWGEASDILEACVDKAVEYFEDFVSDGDDIDDAVGEAVDEAINNTCMYYTDALALIWACGAYDDAIGAAIEKISDEVYNEFYQRIDPEDYKKEGRRKTTRMANMRKRAYYWESMEYNGVEYVEFEDIIPIDVGPENYPFTAQLYVDDVTWDEYDENESYEWSFIIYEDGMYEWGEYYATFYGTQAEAEMWGVDMEGKFEDDYERGVIEPQGDYDY